MAGSPYLAVYTRDITSRKNVKLLRSEGKALWAWFLFNAHIEDVWGMRHTPEEYGIIVDLPPDEVRRGIDQMDANGVGNIARHEDGTISISSNRMQRDIEKREQGRKRTQRWRGNADDASPEPSQDASPTASQEPSHPTSPSRAGTRPESESDIEDDTDEGSEEEGVQGEKPRRVTAKDCESIYAEYPRKAAKVEAIKRIKQAVRKIDQSRDPPDDPVKWLRGRVKLYAASVAGKDPQFIPHCSTWMYQARYADEPEQTEHRTPGGRRDVARDYEETRRITYAALGIECQPVGDGGDG